MGLDMYLYGCKDEYHTSDYNIGHRMTFDQIGYWRKSNCIHKWFVELFQQNNDDCRFSYPLYKEDLQALKDRCEDVLLEPERAEELLPTQEGFFFGDTGYNENYTYDLKETIEICDWCLNSDYKSFYYCSSW